MVAVISVIWVPITRQIRSPIAQAIPGIQAVIVRSLLPGLTFVAVASYKTIEAWWSAFFYGDSIQVSNSVSTPENRVISCKF